MPRAAHLIWKIPLAVIGTVIGAVLLLLIVAAGVLVTPAARQAVLAKGVEIANEQTDYDIDIGRLSIVPGAGFPMPVRVEIDSLFVGHRSVDTLIHVRRLRLSALLKANNNTSAVARNKIPIIVVDTLLLEQAVFHSDSLIATVGVDVIVGLLAVSSPEINIAEGRYPLHGLRLNDVFCGIDLRPTPPDTTTSEVVPLKLLFDLPDGELSNIHFRLTPLGLDIQTGSLDANALVDVGANRYDARRIDVGDFVFSLGSIRIPVDTIYGSACADIAHNLISSEGLHVRSDEIGAQADLEISEMNLSTMQIKAIGAANYQGNQAHLCASYDIDDEVYNATVHIDRVNLSPFLKDSTPVIIAGDIEAAGRGINPKKSMRGQVNMHLTDAVYDNINVSGIHLNATLADKTVRGSLHLPFAMYGDSLQVRAKTEHQFSVSDFMTPKQMAVDYHTQMSSVRVQIANQSLHADTLSLDFSTDSAMVLELTTDNMRLTAQTPMHVFQFVDELQPLLRTVSDSAVIRAITSLSDITMLDTLRHRIPAVKADITLKQGSPLQPLIDSLRMNIDEAVLALSSDSVKTELGVSSQFSIFNFQIPATLGVSMEEGKTDVSLNANTHLMGVTKYLTGLRTDAALRFELTRNEREIRGNGILTLDSLNYNDLEFGDRSVAMTITPSESHPNAIQAGVQMNDVPLDIVDSILKITDLDLRGAVRAKASVDGLPKKLDISAEVLPLGVAAQYKPYQMGLSLGEIPIVMEHNKVDLNGLPIYGADSTYIALTGGLDLNTMRMDISLAADSFAPVKLPQDGPIPVYGDLAIDICGTVTGPMDSIVADVDVTILPTTDITYPISKKNLAQVKPYGTVNVRYNTADTTANALSLGGQINVDNGFVRYSPKAYPIMPFHVDSGSHVTFNGPIGKTFLDVSASQKVKADVESSGEETRRVDFITGVRVNGIVDSIGLHSINFFLEAPDDEAVTHELVSVDEDTREGLAATLLATGMYVGESNVAAQRDYYALSSIVNSRLNAAMANSKIGKFIDVDISSGQTNHAVGKTNDMNIAISKDFFKNKLRVTVGSTISDNPDVNKTNGLLSNITADYKLTKEGNVLLRLFTQRDYNNILEGELYKSGLAVRATKEWNKPQVFRGDSITRTYGLTADVGVAYRSNNSIGPDITIKPSIKNLLGRGEILTIKANGAYFWALRNRNAGDAKKTDTYKLGVNASLVFPYLHWVGDNNPDGDTRYMLGYQYENIAGGYGVHKFTGSFTYFIRSKRSAYITHAFTPASLSVVRIKAETDSLLNKAAVFPQLIKVLASNEFVPAIGYNFIFNNYRSMRSVNTSIDLGIKESGNLINAIYCLFGHSWNEKDKKLGSVTFNQFVKLTAELRNKFVLYSPPAESNLSDVAIATRLYAGANIPLGNSNYAPLSEGFYAGGPNSMRSASPYAYGPGNFYSAKYSQSFFHAGDVKLEANFELRFPIVWKLCGAAFVDAGNVWNWYSSADQLSVSGSADYITTSDMPEPLYIGLYNNPEIARQIALGTGAGLRLDLDGLVIRLDIGVAIHAPYQTYKYDKEGKVDKTRPINTYFNIPSALDAIRINFGIGYPF